MVPTLNIIGAFILGGLIPFGVMGAVIGYYWARADVRKAVFQWFNEHWPVEFNAVAKDMPYDCSTCSTPCNDAMSYCPGCAKELDIFRGIGDTDGRS